MKKWNKKVVKDDKVYYPNRRKIRNPGSYNGSYKLPVRGGRARWEKLGLGN